MLQNPTATLEADSSMPELYAPLGGIPPIVLAVNRARRRYENTSRCAGLRMASRRIPRRAYSCLESPARLLSIAGLHRPDRKRTGPGRNAAAEPP